MQILARLNNGSFGPLTTPPDYMLNYLTTFFEANPDGRVTVSYTPRDTWEFRRGCDATWYIAEGLVAHCTNVGEHTVHRGEFGDPNVFETDTTYPYGNISWVNS